MAIDTLSGRCGITPDNLLSKSCTKPETLSAFTPYLVGNQVGSKDAQILAMLSPQNVSMPLTHLSLTLGADNVSALAEITPKLHE